MLKSIAEEITVALASNDIIETDEMEAYSYGLELLIPKIILYAAILVVSLITDTFFCKCYFRSPADVFEKICGRVSLQNRRNLFAILVLYLFVGTLGL